MSATELLAAYRAKTLSPVEALRTILEHIEAWEPHLKATYRLDPEGALAAATRSERRWLRGEARGPLDGVPITIKDNIATKGVPVPLGTAASELTPAPADAPPAARVREAGTVLLGKTTMPDYGMLSSGLSSFHPLARNPWDLSKNPGGSSSGAAAAAAAGYGPLHIGTDIGGSVRLPAGWCGIFALKPSLGRVPIDPPYIGRVAGPMTRSVADSALLMSVLAKPDARDHMSLPYQPMPAEIAPLEPEGLHIGLLTENCGLPVDAEIASAVEAAARLFESAGATVEPMRPFFTREMLDGLDHFWRLRAYLDVSALPEERRAKALPFIVDWAMSAAPFGGAKAFRDFNQIMATRQATVAASAAYDYVLSPVSPVPPFRADWPCPTNDPTRPLDHIAFTVPYNMSEQPAASINCGVTSDGMPIGLQIAGRRFDDVGVMRIARWFEEARGPQRPWPKPPEC